MSNSETIDITSDAFARRLSNLLRDRRDTSGAALRELARASDGAFTPRFLRAAEDGRAELDEQTVCELAALYGAELAEILPSRLPLRISEPSSTPTGVISTSGISAEFDAADRDSLLTSYLFLVRQLRDQQREPIIDLRREDVETIAEYLQEPGPSVLERLSTLMGATQLQRRAMAGMFIAGAIVIGLAGSGVAAFTGTLGGAGGAQPSAARVDAPPTVVVTAAEPDEPLDGAVVGGISVRSILPAEAYDQVVDAIRLELRPVPTPSGGDGTEPVTSVPTAPVETSPTVAELPAPVVPVVPVGSLPASTTPSAPVVATSSTPGTSNGGNGANDSSATGTPPTVPATGPVVADPPAANDSPTTEPEPTIPDLPFDPPSTTNAPATADPPVTTDPPATATPPTPTTQPSATDTTPPDTTPSDTTPPDTTAPDTTAPDTTVMVATGQPPVPPGG